MQEIRFNHNYKKLHNQKTAYLIYTYVVVGKELSKEYIKYDTDGKYKIEDEQEYLQLFFIGNKGIPFSTLRKYNYENRQKYSLYMLKNRNFKIIIG